MTASSRIDDSLFVKHCPMCRGLGRVLTYLGSQLESQTVSCDNCGGTGHIVLEVEGSVVEDLADREDTAS